MHYALILICIGGLLVLRYAGLPGHCSFSHKFRIAVELAIRSAHQMDEICIDYVPDSMRLPKNTCERLGVNNLHLAW